MSDLEERLRATMARRSMDYEPAADLPERIHARVRHHRLRRQVTAAVGLLSAAAALVVVVTVIGLGSQDEDSIRMVDDSTTSTSRPTTTSTSSTSKPQGPAVEIGTPLSRQGIGPIVAGMTLREAEAAARVPIPPPATSEGPCVVVRFQGVQLVVEPGADPMDGVVRAVSGVSIPGPMGFRLILPTREELVAALGPPTRIEDRSADWGPSSELLLFEADGFAYGALFTPPFDERPLTLESGDPAWFGHGDCLPG